MEDAAKDIAKQVVTRYSDGGIVSLSFGLLLIALLWDAWQSRKQASKERETFSAQLSSERKEYMGHVITFVEATAKNSEVIERSTTAHEEMTREFRSLADSVGKLADRVDRMDGRNR